MLFRKDSVERVSITSIS